MLYCIVDGWNHRRNDNIRNLFCIHAKIIEERDHLNPKLICRAVYLRAHTPGMKKLVPLENAALDICISQINH